MTPLSPAEARTVTRFENAEPAPESWGGGLRTPDAWSRAKGVRVLDPDGWRIDDQDWDEPIAESEFTLRAAMSTHGPWDWTARC